MRELYATRLAEEIHASPESVLQEIERRIDTAAGDNPRPAARTNLENTQPEKSPAASASRESLSREELYVLALVAAEPSLADEAGITSEDFSPGPVRTLAESALEHARDGTLDLSVLIELCADLTVRDYPLHDLIARVSMRLDELFGQNLRQGAAEQLWRLRKQRLRQQLETLQRQYRELTDEDGRNRLKQDILALTRRLTELKQKPDWQP